MKAYQKLNKFTRSHWTWLEDRGYEVTPELLEDGEYLVIEHTGFMGVLEVTPQNLQVMIGQHNLLTYTSVLIFPDGEKLSGIKAAARLGEMGALITHPTPPSARKLVKIQPSTQPKVKKLKIIKF